MNSNSKAAAIIAYITWVGFFIALLIRDKTDRYTAHHLNQALIINILSLIGGVIAAIPFLGTAVSGVVSLAVFVFWIMGVYRAATGSTEPLPFIGDYHLID